MTLEKIEVERVKFWKVFCPDSGYTIQRFNDAVDTRLSDVWNGWIACAESRERELTGAKND